MRQPSSAPVGAEIGGERGRETVMEELRHLVTPAAVAVIGASDDPRKMGGAALRNLLAYGYSGDVYPINRRSDTVQGIRAFPALDDCPSVPETAIVAVPAADVPEVLRSIGRVGIRSATIVSSGLSATSAGPKGARLLDEMSSVVDEYRLTILGPNTAGVAHFNQRYVPRAVLNSPDVVSPSGLAIVSQSGALSNVALCQVVAAGRGVGLCVGTGDEHSLRVDHWLEYAALDPQISTVLAIVEGIRDGAGFAASLQRLAEVGKPCVVLKIGTSERGRAMALTHTGALTGDQASFEAVVDDCGGIRVESLDEAWRLGSLMEWLVPRLHFGGGRPLRVGLICGSGGEGGLLADQYARSGVDLPEPSDRFTRFVESNFGFASTGNPFDLTGQVLSRPDLVGQTVASYVGEGVDLLHIAFPTFRDELGTELFRDMGSAISQLPQPVLITSWPIAGLTDLSVEQLRRSGALVIDKSEVVPSALGQFCRWVERHASRSRSAAGQPGSLQGASAKALTGLASIDEKASYDLVDLQVLARALGLRVPNLVDSRTFDPRDLTYPVFVKGYVPGVLHKAAAGLVQGPLTEPSAVLAAIAQIRAAAGKAQVTVEECVEGFEVLVGIRVDPDFGWTMTVGFGGALAEVIGHASIFSGLTTEAELRRRLADSTLSVLMRRLDQDPASSLQLLQDAVSRIWTAAPQLCEKFGVVEFNPIFIDTAAGVCWAADATAMSRSFAQSQSQEGHPANPQ